MSTFRTVEQLQATVAEQALEIKRLTGCLAKANANHEHFEREWYLSDAQIASLTAEIERLRLAVRLAMEIHLEGLVDFDEYGLTCSSDIYSLYSAALQPKEGEG